MRDYSYDDFIYAVNKLVLLINGKPMLMADFLEKNKDIIIKSLFTNTKQRSLLLHPGSNLLFILAVVYFAFFEFIKNNSEEENWLFSLMPKDIVINTGNNKRCEVLEINRESGYIVLLSGQNEFPIKYIFPINKVTSNKLRPYYGKATALDGRGIRKKVVSEKEIFSLIFDIDKELIRSIIDTSFVVICKKQEADFIMNSILLKVKETSPVKLCNLFPAAYYTSSSNWTNYAGNSANVDPIIKFTSKTSVARELVLEDEEKRIKAVLVNGAEYILSGITELNDLLIRNSLPNVTMLAHITWGDYTQLLNQYEDIKLFAWTREAILSVVGDLTYISKNRLLADKDIVVNLYQLINNLCENDLNYCLVNSAFDNDVIARCRKTLHSLKDNLPESDNKSYFITYTFSLLKLMEQACFPLSIMEDMINRKQIGAISPNEILKKLIAIAKELNTEDCNYNREVNIVVEYLLSMQELIKEKNPKFDYMKYYLSELIGKNNDPIAIIMPKEYYCKVFTSCLNEYEEYILSKCDFSTAKRFNKNKLYKKVVVLGILEDLDFNALTLSNAESTDFIGYPFEEWRLESLKTRVSNLMEFYDEYNNIEYEYFSSEESYNTDYSDIVKFEYELESFIDKIKVEIFSETLNREAYTISSVTKVDKLVIFETGDYAFFTAHYSPYRYNPILETVEEVDINSIGHGDVLIFTNIDEETSDVVDRVLDRLIDLGKLSYEQKESYRKSKYWKNSLRNYMDINSYTYALIARKLGEFGAEKHEVTVRSWLNEDSRIVGPRDPESFYSIALLTDDKEMLENPDEFYEACNEIRSLRIRILKYIGKLIVRSVVSQSNDNFEEILISISGDIRQMARTLQIETIKDVNTQIPSHMANRIHFTN